MINNTAGTNIEKIFFFFLNNKVERRRGRFCLISKNIEFGVNLYESIKSNHFFEEKDKNNVLYWLLERIASKNMES